MSLDNTISRQVNNVPFRAKDLVAFLVLLTGGRLTVDFGAIVGVGIDVVGVSYGDGQGKVSLVLGVIIVKAELAIEGLAGGIVDLVQGNGT